MEQKFIEIQLDEITNLKRITVSSLFIISKGMFYHKKVLLYYVRCYSYQTGILETVIQQNKLSSTLQSTFFLTRLGYIHNKIEKSLTIVYECPDKGEVLTIEGFLDQEMDKCRKLTFLNEMFQIVYHIKKRNPSLEVGCIYPHLFFSFFTLDKHLLMVDYIYSSLLQSSKNNTIRLLNGYFESTTCDEILMSCIMISFFFMEMSSDTSSIIHIILNVYNNLSQTPDVQSQILAKNIEIPLIKVFLVEILKNKKDIDYIEFYTKFKELHSKLKAIIPKAELKINERFFRIIGETKDEISRAVESKSELEFFFKNMPKTIPMTYSKHIGNKYFNDFEMYLNRKKIKKEQAGTLNDEYNELLSKYEKRIKEHLKYKLDKIKSQPVISEEKITKLQNIINELKQHISTTNDINTDSSLLINLENDGKEITNRLEIFKTQIIPRLFKEYLVVIEDFPHSLQSLDNINFLCQKPQYDKVGLHYHPFIKQGTQTIEILQLEKDGKGNSQQTKYEFQCKFKTSDAILKQFPKGCKWLKYSSYVLINGGENTSGGSLTSTMIVNLTQKEAITVYQRKDMKIAKKNHSLCRYSNYKMISVGGNTKSAEVYSIFPNKWESLPDLNSERENGVLCLFNESDLYYFGGKSESNSIDHLIIKEDDNESKWELFELDHTVSFESRAYIKHEKHNMHKLIILGGSMSSSIMDESYNTFMVDLNEKKVEEYKSKITFNMSYQFFESEMELIDNSYVQIGVDDKNKNNAILVSFAKGLFVVN